MDWCGHEPGWMPHRFQNLPDIGRQNGMPGIDAPTTLQGQHDGGFQPVHMLCRYRTHHHRRTFSDAELAFERLSSLYE